MAEQKENQNLPTFAQTVNLAIFQVGNTLADLRKLAELEYGIGGEVEDVVYLLSTIIGGMKKNPPKTWNDFCELWCGIIGVARVASRYFQVEGGYKCLLERLHQETEGFLDTLEILAANEESEVAHA
ncbi:hypothetical protein [Hydrogenophaga sp. NFH-34]|uniref:hypothetical protein n=1 Tax=Hydrogenophaga sp. NFH-34 TaxID=2744446 RepID=UPI001F4372F3|nr:hypothetical protein [Hydrogenophaga sp. NFH-34]